MIPLRYRIHQLFYFMQIPENSRIFNNVFLYRYFANCVWEPSSDAIHPWKKKAWNSFGIGHCTQVICKLNKWMDEWSNEWCLGMNLQSVNMVFWLWWIWLSGPNLLWVNITLWHTKHLLRNYCSWSFPEIYKMLLPFKIIMFLLLMQIWIDNRKYL